MAQSDSQTDFFMFLPLQRMERRLFHIGDQKNMAAEDRWHQTVPYEFV